MRNEQLFISYQDKALSSFSVLGKSINYLTVSILTVLHLNPYFNFLATFVHLKLDFI